MKITCKNLSWKRKQKMKKRRRKMEVVLTKNVLTGCPTTAITSTSTSWIATNFKTCWHHFCCWITSLKSHYTWSNDNKTCERNNILLFSSLFSAWKSMTLFKHFIVIFPFFVRRGWKNSTHVAEYFLKYNFTLHSTVQCRVSFNNMSK